MEMDISTLRAISSLLVCLTFIGIVVWVFSSKRDAKDFEQAAQLPFEQD